MGFPWNAYKKQTHFGNPIQKDITKKIALILHPVKSVFFQQLPETCHRVVVMEQILKKE